MLAAALLDDTLEALAADPAPRSDVVIYHDPPDAAGRLRAISPPGTRFLAQPAGGLGDRLAYGSEALLAAGYDACVILAADSPFAIAGIGTGWLPRTRDEIVLGPCADGGYWFVALSRPAAIFGCEMSRDDVLEQTIAAATALGRPVRLLDPELDIDTVDDLELAEERGLLERAPRTRRVWESARSRASH
jgi:hypothetical protein